MTIRNKAYIAGAYEHPTRLAPDKTTPQLHAECAAGALADAGLSLKDVDGYFCAGDAPGFGGMSMVDYMGLKVRHTDSTETGGSSYILHVSHAAQAIAAGHCSVALITLAGRPRSERFQGFRSGAPEGPFENWVGATTHNSYGMCAMRHIHEYGTTSEQLAWIKVAASTHAQYNPHAMLKDVVSVEDVLSSPMISDPLHRLDCCVVSDGGGALIVVAPEIARSLKKSARGEYEITEINQRFIGVWRLNVQAPGEKRNSVVTLACLSGRRLDQLRAALDLADATATRVEPIPSRKLSPVKRYLAWRRTSVGAMPTRGRHVIAVLTMPEMVFAAATNSSILLIFLTELLLWFRFSEYLPRRASEFMVRDVQPHGSAAVRSPRRLCRTSRRAG